jgi:hypothetical protein
VRPRLIVDLDLAIGQVVPTSAAALNPDAGSPAPGQYVFHSDAGDRDFEAWPTFEVSEPVTVGTIVIVPLLAMPDRRLWVLRIDPTG